MKINTAVYSVEKWITVAFMYSLVLVLFINVLFRFVLFIPAAWAEELGRYLFVWVVYVGSATAMYKWEHIDINLIDLCDAIYMLRGWDMSRGANREYGYASGLGKTIMYQKTI